jgi:hypothetical protein
MSPPFRGAFDMLLIAREGDRLGKVVAMAKMTGD